MFEYLSVSKPADHPGIAVVSLNRPRKRNAINAKLWREIGHVFGLLGTSGDDVRCVLLWGSGKAFCAGIDTSDPSFGLIGSSGDDEGDGDGDGDGDADIARRAISFRPKILGMQAAFTALEKCPVPVVCAIHGFCIGAGVDLITAADVRICSPSAVFSVREAKLGLAADVGTLQRLPKVVGHSSRIRELCFTGRDFGAEEAAHIGLVSSISESDTTLLGDAIKICRRIAANSPVAVALTKQSLNYSRDHSVADGLGHIATLNSAALITDDIINSMSASYGSDGDGPRFAKLLPMARL